jgi:4-hydroxythreonine-4-phosphate dehydrogenase
MIRLAVTPGEGAGVGPELMYHLAQRDYEAKLVLVCSKELIRERLSIFPDGKDIELIDYDPQDETPSKKGTLCILNVDLNARAVAGVLDKRNASYILKCLDIASDKSQAGEFLGMITGPISKAVIADCGLEFTGHTEYLQERTHTKTVVMLLGCRELNVALVTTHLPLSAVSAAITSERLEEICRVLNHDLKTKFGCAQPKILACGLNPHAGENGHLGMEELTTIIPTFEKLRQEGMDIEGPFPADTIFNHHNLERADAFLTMYHDQGLPVLKYIGFDHGYNTTLGLPYIRTSVDHGTALDIAGRGIADPGSLYTAVDLAIKMAFNRSK